MIKKFFNGTLSLPMAFWVCYFIIGGALFSTLGILISLITMPAAEIFAAGQIHCSLLGWLVSAIGHFTLLFLVWRCRHNVKGFKGWKWIILVYIFFVFLVFSAKFLSTGFEFNDRVIQYNIGASKFLGKDYKGSAFYMEKSAKQGYPPAQIQMCRINFTAGLKRGYPKAFLWCSKAAKLGDPASKLVLGVLYINGLGVKQDLKTAYRLFTEVSKGHDDIAKTARNILTKVHEQNLKATTSASVLNHS